MDKLNSQVTSVGNTGLAKVAVQCAEIKFGVNKSLVLCINSWDKIPNFSKSDMIQAMLKNDCT